VICIVILVPSFGASLAPAGGLSSFTPCAPASEPIEEPLHPYGDLDFCADWNPDFVHNGYRCCAKPLLTRRQKRRATCAQTRRKFSFCDEMTEEQRKYDELVKSGKIGDVLAFLSGEVGKNGQQAYCAPAVGFLAYGRRIIGTQANRIKVKNPERCVDFGTDRMAAMMEFVGRQIAQEYADPKYANLRLLIGDVSAPRGGCIMGRSGRRGHASHTNGQDADVAFLGLAPGGQVPEKFGHAFDPKMNWWFIKQFFKNPFVCVKVIFLDRRLIRKLEKAARGDPDWPAYRRFVRHMRGHRNHLHVRVGEIPGEPGCKVDPSLEEEFDDEGELSDSLTESLHPF
jgi:murein endopeptidase